MVLPVYSDLAFHPSCDTVPPTSTTVPPPYDNNPDVPPVTRLIKYSPAGSRDRSTVPVVLCVWILPPMVCHHGLADTTTVPTVTVAVSLQASTGGVAYVYTFPVTRVVPSATP